MQLVAVDILHGSISNIQLRKQLYFERRGLLARWMVAYSLPNQEALTCSCREVNE